MDDEEKDYSAIIRYVRGETGFNLELYRESYIKRRMNVRMHSAEVKTYRDYYTFLRKNQDESKMMVEELSINVTKFFRDLSTWKFCRDTIFPKIIAAKKECGEKRICIWSAGCSFGEEAYSISMLMHELLGEEINRWHIDILASDFDQGAIDIAQTAVFDETHFTETPQKYMDKYLEPFDGKYRVLPKVKKLVRYRKHDLISGDKMKNMDMVFCRNVVIYFGDELKKRLYTDYYDALNLGGYLMIGKTELLTGDARNMFKIINSTERIYRKPME